MSYGQSVRLELDLQIVKSNVRKNCFVLFDLEKLVHFLKILV